MENFNFFFGILTIHNDERSYVKYVLDPLYVVFTCLGVWKCVWRGLPRGLGHNLLMQFSTLYSSKMEISETDFFYILTIQNDQTSNVNHALDPLHVFFTLFGCLEAGVRQLRRGWGTTWKFPTPIFLYSDHS